MNNKRSINIVDAYFANDLLKICRQKTNSKRKYRHPITDRERYLKRAKIVKFE